MEGGTGGQGLDRAGTRLTRLEAPLPVDNFEGLAITPAAGGKVHVWLISDDNQAVTQRTLLWRLELDLADLPKRRVREYLTGIRTNATQIRDQLALATTRCGGDVVNPDLPERVLSAYAEVLPKTLRGLDPAGRSAGNVCAIDDLDAKYHSR